MPSLLPDLDPDGLLEYSVVFTDRSLNHMSVRFQRVMNDILDTLNEVYRSDSAIIVPGGGSYGMEAVARQFAHGQRCLIIRNGFFSYRWSQILEMGNIPSGHTVLQAAMVDSAPRSPFAPASIDMVTQAILNEKPALVFAPHVETSAGMMLAHDYLARVADAVHRVGGLFVLDCIASGAMWVDMQALGVDILVSAPQKGWSASPCAGLVMLNGNALAKLEQTTSSSFSCDLKKWHQIMQAYINGGHAYHATMPTDALVGLRDAMDEMRQFGFDNARNAQVQLGGQVRHLLRDKGIKSVAAQGFEAPSVVVAYTDDANLQNGSKFAANGLQIAAGVPLMCGEPDDFKTFRLGLFGLDKLGNIERTVDSLAQALDKIVWAEPKGELTDRALLNGFLDSP